MAQHKVPDPLKLRHLLESQSGAAAGRTADACLAAGQTMDAIEFLVLADETEKLEALRQDAISSGDVFLLRALVRATGVAVETEQWQATADAAEAAGKLRYAADARRLAESRGD